MIRILENDLPSSVKINNLDKHIGLVGENNATKRVFVFPALYRGIDLSSDDYVAVLQLRLNEDEYAPLIKEVHDDEVHYIWTVKREYLINPGKLLVNLSIKSVDEESDISLYTYLLEFNVIENLNPVKEVEKIPPNIMERYVIEVAAHAQNAYDEANRAKQVADDLELKIIENQLAIMNEEYEVLPKRQNIQFIGADIEDDEDGNLTKVFIRGGTGGEGGGVDNHALLKNLQYEKSGHTGFAPAGNYSEIIYSDSYLTFPNQGDNKNLYVDTTANMIYRWHEAELRYYMLGTDVDEIKIINGGSSIG